MLLVAVHLFWFIDIVKENYIIIETLKRLEGTYMYIGSFFRTFRMLFHISRHFQNDFGCLF